MKLKEVCSCGAMIEAEDDDRTSRRNSDGSGTGYALDTVVGWRSTHNHDMTSMSQPLDPPLEVCAGCGGELPVDYNWVRGAKFCDGRCLNALYYALRDTTEAVPQRFHVGAPQ